MPLYDLTAEPPHPDHGPTVVNDHPCTGCGYNLRGIPVSGNCPECGRAATLSLRGEALRFASRDYLKALDSGLVIILTSILLYAALYVAHVFLLFMAARGATGAEGWKMLAQGLMLIPSGLFIWGYWKFTAPDPGFTGREKPGSARNVARIAACVQTGAKLILVACAIGGATPPSRLSFLTTSSTAATATPSPGAAALMGMAMLATVIEYAAWATLYFSIMIYTRWLARRIPDQALVATTKGYIWLLPLVHFVGWNIGAVISLILYAGMFQTLRQRTAEILDWQERGGRHVFGA